MVLPKPVRELPADLAAVLTVVAATCVTVLVPVLNETPLRVVFGLAFILFVPGYAFVAALFPEAGAPPEEGFSEEKTGTANASGMESSDDAQTTARFRDRGIDGIERVALSFGLSIAIVPLLGLVLNFTPWGIRLVPILLTVAGFTVVATGLAALRRRSLPADERFRVPYRHWIDEGREELFNPETRLDGALNVVLVASILLAVGAVGYAVVVPPAGEQFTEFYLLTEDENEELVAADYPTEFTVGEPQPVVVGIGNHEHEELSYTVVVQLQTVEREGNETTVIERTEIDRFSSPLVADNGTWQTTRDITPTRAGERLRVKYLLYQGGPPAAPTAENAYRDAHLWINVTQD
ncbi:DUF1616 domain-containing protein [Halovenus salina]|uniref:DUF1616 domain-containing protein n=1 Tax=Halovenus salina TaxID=1510225 RepID=UPI002260C9CC|nr:DUF1616 domain-containing protein [Halovenus salina]